MNESNKKINNVFVEVRMLSVGQNLRLNLGNCLSRHLVLKCVLNLALSDFLGPNFSYNCCEPPHPQLI